MVHSLYAATSGMTAGLIEHDVIAGNLANIDTPGYKRDIPITGSFREEVIRSLGTSGSKDHIRTTPLGFIGYGAYIHGISSDHSQGPLVETEGSLDLGIKGEGYFVVRGPSGDLYTRAGTFKLSQSGTVTTTNDMPVIGTRGPVTIPHDARKVEVSADGTILVDGEVHDKFRIVSCNNPFAIEKIGSGMFRIPPGNIGQAGLGTFTVRQGFLEMSNVNPIGEMVRMISGMRRYEACQKMIWAIDQTLDKTVNDVGRVV